MDGEKRYEAACRYAEASDDPLAVMLRRAAAQLDREPPDVFGAKLTLHGARLAQAHQALSTKENERGR